MPKNIGRFVETNKNKKYTGIASYGSRDIIEI
jgi:hypothetical protein